MLDFGFYNMDCLEGMKEFPDKYFDLAVVNPPYGGGFTEGGGCKGWFSKYRQDQTDINRGGGTDSANGSTDTNTLSWKRWKMEQRRQKNCCVGYSARKRLFRRTFPYLT